MTATVDFRGSYKINTALHFEPGGPRHWVRQHMSDNEVFESGASPDLRRTTRSSGRKRTSTGSAPYSRPKQKRKMQTVRSPQGAAAGRQGSVPPVASPAAGQAANTGQATTDVNSFASLAPPGQESFMSQMQDDGRHVGKYGGEIERGHE